MFGRFDRVFCSSTRLFVCLVASIKKSLWVLSSCQIEVLVGFCLFILLPSLFGSFPCFSFVLFNACFYFCFYIKAETKERRKAVYISPISAVITVTDSLVVF